MRKIRLSIEFEAEEGDFDKLENYGINNFVNDVKDVLVNGIEFPNGIIVKCEEIIDISVEED